MYKEIKNLHDALYDEESKYIFRQLIAYSLSEKWEDLKRFLLYVKGQQRHKTLDIWSLVAHPEDYAEKSIVVFGAGFWGEVCTQILSLSGLKIDYYCDNSEEKAGKEFQGKRILSADELKEKCRDALVVIAVDRFEKDIADQLHRYGYNEKQIVRLRDTKQKVYFDDEIVSSAGDDVFVDGGCYDGYTTEEFLRWTDSAKKIYAFEPDASNFKKCEQYFKKNVTVPYALEMAGLYKTNGMLSFSDTHDVAARFSETGHVQVSVVSLDEVIGAEEKITFIKMDIEGMELEALHGAVHTLQRCQPTMAICLYHKPEDIWEIPRFVHEVLPSHRLYIRHYSPWVFDTILYAVPT